MATPQTRPGPTSLPLAERYGRVRAFTETLAEPLCVEDQVVQSAPFVSPTKWHLAHTTWFFETFILSARLRGYTPIEPAFTVLFNSYYNGVGEQFPQARRGLLSRPTVAEVADYRRRVDARLLAELDTLDEAESAAWAELIELGLHHEQQHQELLLTDIKHVLAQNPLYPSYRLASADAEAPPPNHGDDDVLSFLPIASGLVEVGSDGATFCYDNERPRHRVFLGGAELADRLTTNADYLAFITDGGYRRPELWLDDGWAFVQREGWTAPLYWELKDGA